MNNNFNKDVQKKEDNDLKPPHFSNSEEQKGTTESNGSKKKANHPAALDPEDITTKEKSTAPSPNPPTKE